MAQAEAKLHSGPAPMNEQERFEPDSLGTSLASHHGQNVEQEETRINPPTIHYPKLQTEEGKAANTINLQIDVHPQPTSDARTSSKDSENYTYSQRYAWLTPHAAEYRKHMWYNASLGMDSLKVTDEWGFHSARASRSHTPDHQKSN